MIIIQCTHIIYFFRTEPSPFANSKDTVITRNENVEVDTKLTEKQLEEIKTDDVEIASEETVADENNSKELMNADEVEGVDKVIHEQQLREPEEKERGIFLILIIFTHIVI